MFWFRLHFWSFNHSWEKALHRAESESEVAYLELLMLWTVGFIKYFWSSPFNMSLTRLQDTQGLILWLLTLNLCGRRTHLENVSNLSNLRDVPDVWDLSDFHRTEGEDNVTFTQYAAVLLETQRIHRGPFGWLDNHLSLSLQPAPGPGGYTMGTNVLRPSNGFIKPAL